MDPWTRSRHIQVPALHLEPSGALEQALTEVTEVDADVGKVLAAI